MSARVLPALPAGWEPTRATLHAYSQAATIVARAHAPSHPRWWHVSLRARPTGLESAVVPLPDGRSLFSVVDLIRHEVRLEISSGESHPLPMHEGITASEMGERLIGLAAGYGLEGPYDRSKFESDHPRPYDPEDAAAFWRLLVAVDGLLRTRRGELGGDTSPVQVWPHGFDISMEWFGTRTVEAEGTRHPAQLNLGFFPGGDAYFYSNPWPFEEALLDAPLPEGASWHTDGWQGTMLPHSVVASRADAAERVLEYARAVYEIARPTLID